MYEELYSPGNSSATREGDKSPNLRRRSAKYSISFRQDQRIVPEPSLITFTLYYCKIHSLCHVSLITFQCWLAEVKENPGSPSHSIRLFICLFHDFPQQLTHARPRLLMRCDRIGGGGRRSGHLRCGNLAARLIETMVVVGELSLDGIVRHTRGVLPMAAVGRV